MKKHYKNEGLMKILTILGAVVGLILIILRFASLAGLDVGYTPIINIAALNIVIGLIIGLVIVILTFFCALRPGDPIPFNWVVLLILAILLVIFADIWSGVLVLIAALIGLIEDL